MPHKRAWAHHQARPDIRGAALVVALMMLVVVLTLGIGALRLASSEERMAGHALDRQLAFQAAEAALREIESRIDRAPPQAAAACAEVAAEDGSSLRVCPAPAPEAEPRWLTIRAAEWGQATPVGQGAARIAPRYLIEHLGNDIPCDTALTAGTGCRQYRITVSAGGTQRAHVMLQSIYLTD